MVQAMNRNERRKAARQRKAELKEAVQDCLRIESEREASNQRLLDILSIPIETVHSSRGSDKYSRVRLGRIMTQGGVRKYVSRDKPEPMPEKPKPDMPFDVALKAGLVGEKRKAMIGKRKRK